MDVVYLVRPGDRNEELRYSLRSLVNLAHGRVWIAGHKPRWVTGVNHLPVRQARTPFVNTRANLEAACAADVSERFVLMNDDFFILRPLVDIPVLHTGPVSDFLDSRHHPARYRRGVEATAELLCSWGVAEPLCYELHLPMPVRKTAMVDVLDRAGSQIEDVQPRTLYGNACRIGGTATVDCKIRSSSDDGPAEGDAFVSTSDVSFRSRRVGQWLRHRFPDPSPHEAPDVR